MVTFEATYRDHAIRYENGFYVAEGIYPDEGEPLLQLASNQIEFVLEAINTLEAATAGDIPLTPWLIAAKHDVRVEFSAAGAVVRKLAPFKLGQQQEQA